MSKKRASIKKAKEDEGEGVQVFFRPSIFRPLYLSFAGMEEIFLICVCSVGKHKHKL